MHEYGVESSLVNYLEHESGLDRGKKKEKRQNKGYAHLSSAKKASLQIQSLNREESLETS